MVALLPCELLDPRFPLSSSCFPCIPQRPPCPLSFVTHFTAWPFWMQYYILWMWGLVGKDCFSFLRTRCWIQLLLILSDNSIENQWCQVLALVYQCYIAAWLLQLYAWNGVWLLFCRLCWNSLYVTMDDIRQKLKDTGNTPGIIIFSLASLLPASAFRSLRSFCHRVFPCTHLK